MPRGHEYLWTPKLLVLEGATNLFLALGAAVDRRGSRSCAGARARARAALAADLDALLAAFASLAARDAPRRRLGDLGAALLAGRAGALPWRRWRRSPPRRRCRGCCDGDRWRSLNTARSTRSAWPSWSAAARSRPPSCSRRRSRATNGSTAALNAVVTPLYDDARRAAAAPPADADGALSRRAVPASRISTRRWPACRDGRQPLPRRLPAAARRDDRRALPARRARSSSARPTRPSWASRRSPSRSCYGPTRNPWDLGAHPGRLERRRGGGGRGRHRPVAHANDGGGSIRIPAVVLRPVRAEADARRARRSGPTTRSSGAASRSRHAVSRTRARQRRAARRDRRPRADVALLGAARRRARSSPRSARRPGGCASRSPSAPRSPTGGAARRLRRRPPTTPPGCSPIAGPPRRGGRPRRRRRRVRARLLHARLRRDRGIARARRRRAWAAGRGAASWRRTTAITALLGRQRTGRRGGAGARAPGGRSRAAPPRSSSATTWSCSPTLGAAAAARSARSPRAALEAFAQDVLLALHLGFLLRIPGVIDASVRRVFSFIPFTPLANVTGQPAMSVPLYWNAAGPADRQSSSSARFGDEATPVPRRRPARGGPPLARSPAADPRRRAGAS